MGLHFDPEYLSPLTPVFGYVGAAYTMSERVEATASKV
jgi:hypothetical protein